jgi:hypothetical protein
MSTKEADTKIVDEDPKVDPDTGLPEGLDPGYDYMDKSPVAKSEPIPLPYGSRLVGVDPEEALVIEAQERVDRAEAAVEEAEPQTAEEELAAAKKDLAEAEKARDAAAKSKADAEKDTSSTPKTTASRTS